MKDKLIIAGIGILFLLGMFHEIRNTRDILQLKSQIKECVEKHGPLA